MRHEKAIAAALEPLVDDLLALDKRVAGLQLVPGPKGDAGDPGKDCDPDAVANLLLGSKEFTELTKGRDGRDGHAGAGIDSQQWQAGAVYRKGSIVIANLGQHFEALQDTYSRTDNAMHWRRVGSGGFRHRGAFDKDAAYVDGDLFTKEHGTFCMVQGEPVLLAGRGLQGGRGDKGERGPNGRDGSTIIAAQVDDRFKLVLVQQNSDGSIDHLEADFAPAYRKLLADSLSTAFPELAQTIEDMRDDIAQLKSLQQRRRVNG